MVIQSDMETWRLGQWEFTGWTQAVQLPLTGEKKILQNSSINVLFVSEYLSDLIKLLVEEVGGCGRTHTVIKTLLH